MGDSVKLVSRTPGMSEVPMGEPEFALSEDGKTYIRHAGEAEYQPYYSDDDDDDDAGYEEDSHAYHHRGGDSYRESKYAQRSEQPPSSSSSQRYRDFMPPDYPSRSSRAPSSHAPEPSVRPYKSTSHATHGGALSGGSSRSTPSMDSRPRPATRRVGKASAGEMANGSHTVIHPDAGLIQRVRLAHQPGAAYFGPGKVATMAQYVKIPVTFVADFNDASTVQATLSDGTKQYIARAGLDSQTLLFAIKEKIKQTIEKNRRPRSSPSPNPADAILSGIEITGVSNQTSQPVNIQLEEHPGLNQTVVSSCGGRQAVGETVLLHIPSMHTSAMDTTIDLRPRLMSPETSILGHYFKFGLSDDYGVMPTDPSHFHVKRNSLILAMAMAKSDFQSRFNQLVADSSNDPVYINGWTSAEIDRFVKMAEAFLVVNTSVLPVFSSARASTNRNTVVNMRVSTCGRADPVSPGARVPSMRVTVNANLLIGIPHFNHSPKQWVHNYMNKVYGKKKAGSLEDGVIMTADPFVFISASNAEWYAKQATPTKGDTPQ